MNLEKYKSQLPTAAEIETFSPEQAKAVRQTLEKHNSEYTRGIVHGDQVQNWKHAKEMGELLTKIVAVESQPGPAPRHPHTAEEIAEAKATISRLKSDKVFWDQMKDAGAIGHREAKQAWEALHEIGFPPEGAIIGYP